LPKWLDSYGEWIREGYFISFLYDDQTYYEYVMMRDLGHWEYDWPETIAAGATSGPYVPDDLEITRGYDATNNTNQIWQMIFGISGQAYIYIELPTDLHRHGIPKEPKPSSAIREVSHFTELMSPFNEPTFITEHFMMRPVTMQIGFDAYNPNTISMPSLRLNIFLAKLVTERLGYVAAGTLVPMKPRFARILEQLHNHEKPCRPLTLLPVRAPAEAPSGE